MMQIDATIWENLEANSAIGENYNAKLAFPSQIDWMYCAIDYEKKRHILVRISEQDHDYVDDRSKGLKVSTSIWETPKNEKFRIYDLQCLDKAGYSVLDIMASEIVEERKRCDDISEIITKLLAKWREFWSQEKKEILSTTEQIGLFGELWFFSKWLFPYYGQKAIFNWKGPSNSLHDFEFSNCSIEVKATTNTRGRIHTINGLSQLQKPEHVDLILFSLLLHEENGGEYTLKKIVDECINKLEGHSEAINYINKSLSKAGYFSFLDHEYQKTRYKIENGFLYLVHDDFPRLTYQSIPKDELIGIEKVNYEINLNTYSHLIIADSHEQLINRKIIL